MSETPSYTPPPPPPPSPEPPAWLPWEAPNAGLGSLLPTIGGFLVNPIDSFSKMSLTVDLVRPIAYYVIVALIGSIFDLIWGLIFFQSMLGVVRQFLPAESWSQLEPILRAPTVLGFILQLVVAPLVALIVVFVWTAIVHLVLMLIGGDRNGFAATLRTQSYAWTAALAQAIPFVGRLVALVWGLILQIVGLSEAHKIEGWKAAVAVIAPLVACCGCLVAAIVLFGAALVQAIHAAS